MSASAVASIAELETPRDAARRLARSVIRGPFTPEALHCYPDPGGNPIYWRIRARLPDGSKWIRPMRLVDGEYQLGEPEFGAVGKPLYRLGAIACADHARPIVYVEGELCADTLAKLGLMATTSGGATSDDRANYAPLAGRTVILWADLDDAGREHMDRVADRLLTLGCAVERIDVDALGLTAHGDAVDWLAQHPGATSNDVMALARHKVERAAAPPDASVHVQAASVSSSSAERSWPAPVDAAAFHGLAGDIVRAIEPRSEADPSALLMQTLVAFGATVGRGPHVRVEGDEHHANLFGVVVGETAKARKGTSWGRVREIFASVREWPQVVEGLSSGEGLKYAVRDAVRSVERNKNSGNAVEVVTDPGVSDKRLLVTESEFGGVLRQGARAGNTLSATIRAAWDTGSLATLTKNDPVKATGAHVCIIGHITATELRAELTATDTANGFANRFLFVCACRSKMLPFGGGALDESVLRALRERILRAVDHARRLRSVPMSRQAREVWARVYPKLSEGHLGMFGSITARGEAQCIRLALVYALMDESDEIDEPHLLAALALWERAEESARYIFGDALGDSVADDILRALRGAGAPGLTRTAIRDLFKRNQSGERIGAALELLERRGKARSSTQPGEAGRPSELWTAICATTSTTLTTLTT